MTTGRIICKSTVLMASLAVLWTIGTGRATARTSAPDSGPGPSDADQIIPADMTEAADGQEHRVLFINSYHQGYEWSDSLATGAMQVFKQVEPTVKIYVESLDSKHFELTQERSEAEFRRMLEKYGTDFFDVVLVSDDPALDFMKKYRDSLTPGRPVVFCGVNMMLSSNSNLPVDFTGITEPFDYKGIVSMVRGLFPERRTGYLIVDNSLTGRNIIESARKLEAQLPGTHLRILDGSALSHNDLLRELKGLGHDAFVIIGVWQSDRNNRYLTVSEAFRDISNASAAPVFVILRTPASLGFAGGSAISGVHQGREAARMVLEILQGHRVSDMPISNDNRYDKMLNRRQLETRWGIVWENLPAELKSIPDSFPTETVLSPVSELNLTREESSFVAMSPPIRALIVDEPPLMIPGNTPRGVFIEYLNQVGIRTGLEFEWVECKLGYSECIKLAAEQGMVVPGLTDSVDLKDRFSFGLPFARIRTMAFILRDSSLLLGLNNLKGARIAVGGNGYLAKSLPDYILDARIQTFDSSRLGLQALHDGSVDAFIGSASTSSLLIDELGYYDIVPAAITGLPEIPVTIAVPIDMPILSSVIEKGIASMPPDSFDQIRNSYISRIDRIGFSSQEVLKMMLTIALVFLTLVTVLLIRARALKNASRRRELNLRVILDSIDEAVIGTNTNDIVRHMNPVACTMTGWNESEATGMPLDSVLKLADLETGERFELSTAISSGQEQHKAQNSRIQLTAKNGNKYLVDGATSPIKGIHGENLGRVVVFRDVTRRVQIQAHLEQSRKLEAIGQLAGGVAHDFNNMLSAIQGYTELILKKTTPDSNENEYCRRVLGATERAAGLTAKLLDFARKGKGLSTPIDIHESIRSSLALLERSLDKSIVITSSLEAKNPLIIGDPSQIQSIILNLCVNARDAMAGGGRLDISTSNVMLQEADCRDTEFQLTPGEYVLINVHDTGSGIPPEVMNHIFEPFYTTKDVGKGTGLGLAAVHGAIVEHAGSIKVYSEPGNGTLFSIFLPVSQTRIVQPKPAAPLSRTHSGKVLVVEDEELVRNMSEVMLKEIGFEVLTASNGVEAIEVFRQHMNEIRFVLMDVIMPEMDGMNAMLAIQKIRPDTTFVIMSGFAFEHRRDEFMKAGACGFIAKPFRNHDLITVVEDCLSCEGGRDVKGCRDDQEQ
ncbi:response regulator [Myxococcota bacterium]|nr:response regulator [Myxococcota bacterium]